MVLDVGDRIKIRTAPDIDPHLWEHTGLVLGDRGDHRLVIQLDTGEDCTLLEDQVERLADPEEVGDSPFDVYPNRHSGRP
ncbi:MAG: hypothetical protein R3185_04670 [Candidatus Thermoplasmatota archaeon]|nr:hypothetical protein [Candidatus Thermoplasmatota archaeon]